jgi:hypothetical protein
MAMNLPAQPRMTRDTDFVIALTGTKASKIATAFAPDYAVSPQAVRDAIAHWSEIIGDAQSCQFKILLATDGLIDADEEDR